MFRFAMFTALFLSASATVRPADPPVTLGIGYLKGTTDLTLAKAHGSWEEALGPRGVTVTRAGPFPSRAGGVKLVMFAYQPQSAGNEGIVVGSNSPLRTLADL